MVGRPNVGKSTLVNSLVGQKVAIVSDKPQTTRNRILAVVNKPEGQIVLFDTPGIHKPMHRMNRRMVDAAVKSLGQVELAVWVIDVTEPYGPGDRYVREVLKKSGRPVILAINKIDRVPKPKILSAIDQYRNMLDFAEVVPISARDGDNVDRAGLAPPRPPAGGGAPLPGGLPHRPARAVLRGGDDPRADPPPHPRRDPLLDGRGGGVVQGRGGARAHRGHHLRGAAEPEGDRHRRGRRRC